MFYLLYRKSCVVYRATVPYVWLLTFLSAPAAAAGGASPSSGHAVVAVPWGFNSRGTTHTPPCMRGKEGMPR